MADLPRRSLLTAAALAAPAAVAGAARAQDQAPPQSTSGKPLAGKVALVTGAARGIGRAIAVELAREGADVAILDIATPRGVQGVNDYPLASREDLDETERRVRAEGVRALPIVADVRDLERMTGAARRIGAELGGLDIVCANAGVNRATDNLEVWDQNTLEPIMAVNVGGVANTVKAALPVMTQRPGGRVIITSSIAGRRGSSGLSYSASKWAVTGLMKSLAQELGKQGITVNAVAPSGTDTDMFFRGFTGTGSREEVAARTLRDSPLAGVGVLEPKDIADAVVFLAGPRGGRISGATIDVNAGRSASNLG